MRRLTTEEFITKAKIVHNNFYDYSKIVYRKGREKVCIICPIHGEFWQFSNNHLNGARCPKCGLNSRISKRTKTLNDFIEQSKSIHGDKYDYSKVEYVNSHTKVCIICPEHGEFWQSPNNHLSGQGCPKCALEISRAMPLEEFIEKARKVHGDKYNYNEVVYLGNKSKVQIICPIHGIFTQTPNGHLDGCGCPTCGKENSRKLNSSNTKEFISKAKIIYGDYYDYSQSHYANCKKKLDVFCPKHGLFQTTPSNHLSGYGCPKCGNIISKEENILFDYVKSLCNDAIQQDRIILKGKELDIYVPSKHLAIEYNGLRWHSEQFKENADTYHLDKTNLCNEKGIKLINIFEDEWHYKSDIIKSMLANMLGKSKRRIFARKCEIKEAKQQEASNFLKVNNIQDCCYEAKHNIGLYYQNELVSLMTFCEEQNGTVVLNDYCTKLNTAVIGGASKLLKYFIRKEHPHKLYTLVDKRWSNGNLWKKLGFTKTTDNKPNYYYVVDDHRESKLYYNKMSLVEQGFDKDKTEHQIMLDRGIYRIYDCGTMSFEMDIV